MAVKANGAKVEAILSEVEHLDAKERVSLLRGLFRIPKVRKDLDVAILALGWLAREGKVKSEDSISFEEAIQRARREIKNGHYIRAKDLDRELDQ